MDYGVAEMMADVAVEDALLRGAMYLTRDARGYYHFRAGRV